MKIPVKTTAKATKAARPAAAARQQRSLCEVLARLDTPEACRRFLLDLCTPAELAAMVGRWRVARLLARGEAYRKIYERTGVSTATVTRVARALGHGDGGYRLALAVSAGDEEDGE